MKRIIAVVMIAAFCTLPGCKKRDDKAAPAAPAVSAAAAEGAMAPDFSVKDLNGKEVRLSTLKGKVVMVNFWATWCPPCKEEIPSLMKLNKSMEGKPFQMLAISIDDGGKEIVERYFRVSGNSLPAYLDTDGNVSRLYGTTGVPETFIVDRNGLIQKKVVGGMDWNSKEVLAYLDELEKK